MKNKKIITLLLAVTMAAFSFAGCSGVNISISPLPSSVKESESSSVSQSISVDDSASQEMSSKTQEGGQTTSPASAENTEQSNMQGTAYSIDCSGTMVDTAHTNYLYNTTKDNKLSLSYDNGATWQVTNLSLPAPGYKETLSTASLGVFLSDAVSAVAWGNESSAAPLSIEVSTDKGLSWKSSSIQLEEPVTWVKIGFTSSKNGWLITCYYQMAGLETHKLFKTTDGGETWTEQQSNMDAVYLHTITGANFLDDKTGFISYRFDEGLFVSMTEDGGSTWQLLDLKIPDKYEGANVTPLSAIWQDGKITIPISIRTDDYSSDAAYTYNNKNGTWEFSEQA